jgi:putative Holliday junction resolvase
VNGRILAVDPGDQRIGVALSDPTQTLASPLMVIQHVARAVDAGAIVNLAKEHQAVKIIVGQPLDSEGEVGPAARKSIRFAEALRLITDLPVELWDESGSTQAARSIAISHGKSRQKRMGHLDDQAAAVILQSYLDVQRGY